MHDVELPQSVKDRLIKRRGRVEIFDRLQVSQTALLVVDMQNAFVAEGAPVECPSARDIVPNINRLARALRDAGGTVVWIVTSLAAHGPNSWPIYYRNFMTPARGAAHLAAMTPGNVMHAVYSELDPRFKNGGPDLYVEKNRFSAFIQGASDIETQLRDNGLDTLIITGTLSNICSETNARDAMMRGFRVFFASDANAALSDEEHLATLITVASTFGDVRPTKEILSLIGNAAAQAAQ